MHDNSRICRHRYFSSSVYKVNLVYKAEEDKVLQNHDIFFFLILEYLSLSMRFPLMWHFDMCRLGLASAAPFKLRNSKWCSVSSFTSIEYSSEKQRLRLDCAYAHAYMRLSWSHIPYCWKSHALAHFVSYYKSIILNMLSLARSTSKFL